MGRFPDGYGGHGRASTGGNGNVGFLLHRSFALFASPLRFICKGAGPLCLGFSLFSLCRSLGCSQGGCGVLMVLLPVGIQKLQLQQLLQPWDGSESMGVVEGMCVDDKAFNIGVLDILLSLVGVGALLPRFLLAAVCALAAVAIVLYIVVKKYILIYIY